MISLRKYHPKGCIGGQSEYFTVEKKLYNFGDFGHLKKLPKENNRPMGENSPYPVALPSTPGPVVKAVQLSKQTFPLNLTLATMP
jgi:hypothetical protein